MALLLAAVGTYGVVACSVAQRTQEVGIRMALGAAPRDVARLIFGEAAQLCALGLALGIPASILGAQAYRTLLFSTQPTDVQTYAAVIAILVCAVTWAATVPVRRAARVDPAVALAGRVRQ